MNHEAVNSTRKLTTLAMLAAVSAVLAALVHFPILPAAPWLEYDPADIPIFIGTFLFGPWTGLGLAAAVSVLQGITVSAAAGPIGIIMHFFATGSFVFAAGLIYERKKTRKAAVISLIAGILVQTAVMVMFNLLLTPFFIGQSIEKVLPMILPVIVPFNLIKAGTNSLVTYTVYKPVSTAVRSR